jgi:uncharacterized membrane protein YccF (DUF307 family)
MPFLLERLSFIQYLFFRMTFLHSGVFCVIVMIARPMTSSKVNVSRSSLTPVHYCVLEFVEESVETSKMVALHAILYQYDFL